MGDLGLTAAVLRRLAGAAQEPSGFIAWADGSGGAWRWDRALWIRERCDFHDDAIVHAIDGTGLGVAEPIWTARLATPAQREAFLSPLPVWRGIVVGRTAKGLPVAIDDDRAGSPTRVLRGQMHARPFERVLGRIVNGEILAQTILGSAQAAELRSCLARGLGLPRRMRGTTRLDRRLFDLARELAAPIVAESLSERIEVALSGAGARLVDWRLLPDSEVSITWSPLRGALAGQLIETRACALTLGLLHAGICVSGSDHAFDVTSLASAVAHHPGAALHPRRPEYDGA